MGASLGGDPDPAATTPADPLAALSAERLQERLRALAWGEKQVLVSFLTHLREFDRRRGYAPLGYDSLFRYCTAALGLSEDEACLRILAARLALRFPQVLGMLARGETHLSKLAKLSPHLTAENASALLEEASGKSRREVERIAARFGDGCPSSDSVRFLPPPETSRNASPDVETGGEVDDPLFRAVAAEPTAVETAPAPAAAEPEPSNPIRPPSPAGPGLRLVRISFTAPETLLAKIERARALFRHKNPEGRLEKLADEAFEALLEAHDPDRRRLARRRAPALGASGRRIPRRVKDLVWRRDGGRCAFVAPDGTRCGSLAWLEYDHVLPFALGGRSDDAGNVRLLCRTHNQMAARQAFGDVPTRAARRTADGIRTGSTVPLRLASSCPRRK